MASNYLDNTRNRREVHIENSNDPEQPNYRPSFWQRALCRWQETQDWFGDIWDLEILCDYINQKPGEFHEDFHVRLKECCPDERFKTAVEDNAAVLNQFEVNEQTFVSFVDAKENIDLRGKSLKTWDYEMTQRFFRDGVVVVVVDQARREEDGANQELRPFLRWVPITDIYSPVYVNVNGGPLLARICIRRDREEMVPSAQGPSMQTVHRYYEYSLRQINSEDSSQRMGCFVTVWREAKIEAKTQFLEEESYPIIGANGQPMQKIPIEVLSVTSNLEFTKEDEPIPPLYALLKAVIKFTNHESQNDTFEGKVMIPTINEFLELGAEDDAKPLYAGPSRTNIRGSGDRIEVMEPKGGSAKLVYEHQDTRDERISKMDNKYFHLKGGNVTATEAEIENLKSQVKIPSLIEKKESLYQEIIKDWRLFQDPSFNGVDESGGITVSDKAMQMPTDPQDVRNTFDAVTLGILSPQVSLERLTRVGFINQEEFEANNAATQVAPAPPSETIADPELRLG